MRKRVFWGCLGIAAILAFWSIFTGLSVPAILGFGFLGGAVWIDRKI